MPLFPPGANEADIERVYREAHAETKIVYSETGGFFGPNLISINHLEVGQSKTINSLFVRVVERFLNIFQRLFGWAKKLIRLLYPRRYDHIYGTRKDAYITGRLTFAKRNDVATPIHNMRVQLWSRTFLKGWRLFAQGYSDHNGVFKLEFDYMESRRRRYHTFHFEVCQIEHVFFDPENREPDTRFEVFQRHKIPKGDLTGMGYDMGTIQLFYWEYRDDIPVPRVVIKDHDDDAPEYYSDGRNNAIKQQFAPIEITKDKHIAQIKIDPDSISIKKIQADYPKNLTVAMEEKLPYSTRSDYWFGRRLMNGMNCATFLPDRQDEKAYWVKYFGSCHYEVNDEYAFPTVEIKLRIAENGLPIPEEIITTGPTNQYDKDPYKQQRITPADGEKWEYAKRVARVSGGLSTELDDHFSGTHVNTEQYAIAGRRNLRKNPLTTLLFPHLKEVALVNHAADTLLIGPGYIPRASALTANGINQRCLEMMGVLDWKNWAPMDVISDSHTYAKAEHLFWEVVNEFVDHFFKENEEGIRKEWYEVYRFSKDLVHNSAPVFHKGVEWENIGPEAQKLEQKRIEYYHERYRFDRDLPRDVFEGKERVISPITHNPLQPEEGEMENLKNACKYIIMQATFMHTWVNEHQYEDIGEVLYSSLGLRFGNHEEGIFRPEDDYNISPDLTHSTQMMWFSNLLSRTEYGFITRNEENDIDPLFADLLEKRREQFKELYVDIDSIESRTNI